MSFRFPRFAIPTSKGVAEDGYYISFDCGTHLFKLTDSFVEILKEEVDI